MANKSRFLIQNEIGKPLILNIEPEGVFFRLDGGQEVAVTDESDLAPVTLKITCEAGSDPILSIWPGDGDVKVVKDGRDVLEGNKPVCDSLGVQA